MPNVATLAYTSIAVIAVLLLASAAMTSPISSRDSATSARSFEIRDGQSNAEPCPEDEQRGERGKPPGRYGERPDPNFRSRYRDSTSATFTSLAPTTADTFIQITSSPTASPSLHDNYFSHGSGGGIASASLSLTNSIPVTASFSNPVTAAQFAPISNGPEVTDLAHKRTSITSTMRAMFSTMSQRAWPAPMDDEALLISALEQASWSVLSQPEAVSLPTSIPIPVSVTAVPAVPSTPVADVTVGAPLSSTSIPIQLSGPPIVQAQSALATQQAQSTTWSVIAGPPPPPPSSGGQSSSPSLQPTVVASKTSPPSAQKPSSTSTLALIQAPAQLPPQTATATFITAARTTMMPNKESSTSTSLSLSSTPTSTEAAGSGSNNTARIAAGTTVAVVVAFAFVIASVVILRRRILSHHHHKRLESATTTENDSVDIAMDDAPDRSRPLLIGASPPSKKSAGMWGVVEGYTDPWRVSLYRRNDDGSGVAPGTVL